MLNNHAYSYGNTFIILAAQYNNHFSRIYMEIMSRLDAFLKEAETDIENADSLKSTEELRVKF